jgi:hypothetical protein
MAENYGNLGNSTITAQLNAGSTSFSVQSGHGARFPATGNFRLLIESEIMLCTSRSTDTLTVTRGQEGTSDVTHAISSAVTHVLTAASLGLAAEEKAKITVRKNTGSLIGPRRSINFIEGTNVTMTVADDAGSNEFDVTINSSAGGGGGAQPPTYDLAIIYNNAAGDFDVYDRDGNIDDADNVSLYDAMEYCKGVLGTDSTVHTNGGVIYIDANADNVNIPVIKPVNLYNCYGYELVGPGDGGGKVFLASNVADMQGDDNGSTTLNGNITTTGAETVNVTSGTGMPTSGFYIHIESETMYVTSRSGTQLTVAAAGRGVRDTTAATHSGALTVTFAGWHHMFDAIGAGRFRMSGFKLNCNSVQGLGGIIQERRTANVEGASGGPQAFSRIFGNTCYHYTVGAFCQGDRITELRDEGTSNTYWISNHAFDGVDHASISDDFGAFTLFQNDWHVYNPQVNRPTFMYGLLALGGTGNLLGGGHIATGDRAAVALKGTKGGNNTQIGDVYLDNIGAAADEPGILVEPLSGDDMSRLSIRDIYMNGAGGNAPCVLFTLNGASQAKGCVINNIFGTGSGSAVLTAIVDTNDVADLEGLMIGNCSVAANKVVGTAGLNYTATGVNVVNTTAGAGYTPHFDGGMARLTADHAGVTSSTDVTASPGNTTGLSLFLAGNTSYVVRGVIVYEGAEAADMRIRFAGPSGITGLVTRLSAVASITTNSANTDFDPVAVGTDITGIGCTGAGLSLAMQFEAIITLTNSGECKIQYAQSTSDATATIIKANSYIEAKHIDISQL